MFVAVLLMLLRTQNPSLSPVMRLQPAMGNADYCCYSIRQSACVCMCVLAREMEREREWVLSQVLSASRYTPTFWSWTIFSHATPIHPSPLQGCESVLPAEEGDYSGAALQQIDFYQAAFNPVYSHLHPFNDSCFSSVNTFKVLTICSEK